MVTEKQNCLNRARIKGGERFLMAVWSEDITKSIEAIRGDFRAVYWGDETFSRLLFFCYKGKGI